MSYISDGLPGTKLTAVFTHNPVASVTFGDFWFGAGTTPPTISIDRIVAKIGNYRALDDDQAYHNSTYTYVCKFQGCNDYNTSTHTGTFSDLGFSIEGKPDYVGKWIEGTSGALLLKRVNCVRVVWDYMPGPQTGSNQYWAPLHDLEIYGDLVKYSFVALGPAGSGGNSSILCAPGSYEKLRGGIGASASAGAQRTWHYPIGAASQMSAISMARMLLTLHLRMANQRRYEYHGLIPGTPALGITISVDETGDGAADYTGVLREYSISITGDYCHATGTVLSSAAEVIE